MDVDSVTSVSIRGWLEGSREHMALVRNFIEENLHPHWQNLCWRFPHPQEVGHGYAFYGAHVEPDAVGWFLSQLRHLARMAPPAGAGTDPVRGLFMVSEDGSGPTQWQVRDGQVFVMHGTRHYEYLDA